MIKFLLERPIAVVMAFVALFIIGIVTYFTLPVSLLPNIAIPEITVQVTAPNASAREVENTIMKPLRQQLMQVSRLRELRTETRDEGGQVRLSFDFGTNTDLAFIEVNEKIDAAMDYLPRDAQRPRVVKASAGDIPVFCLELTLKHPGSENDFLALSEFAESVIKRRIEQLPEVAMADITGTATREVQIVPDMPKLQSLGISIDDLSQAISDNNIEPGSMTVRDGYYEYNIRFSSILRTIDDVRNIYIRKNGRLFRLKDLARITTTPGKETGFSVFDGKRAVTLAVIKQSDESMAKMKAALNQTIDYFKALYPDIEFHVSRNQTALLDYTISNLKQNLGLGFLFIFIVAIFFLGGVRNPVVIGLSMLTGLVVSFLFFYLFHLSMNIISLAGLIMALDMMIDSSIVVTENITQYRVMGYGLTESCDRGTREVIVPMLTSILTTIVVFVPLVFMSGIAGAVFRDQAIAITVGLMVSYFTSIMLLPVLYKLVKPELPPKPGEVKTSRFNFSFGQEGSFLYRAYDAGVGWAFRHKIASLCILFGGIPACVLLFYLIPKSRMPHVDRNEMLAYVDWNENIHVDENRARVDSLFRATTGTGIEYSAYVGQQQFLLNTVRELSKSESELYFKTPQSSGIAPLELRVRSWLAAHYPQAVFSFSPPQTVFDRFFDTGEADVVAELSPRNKTVAPTRQSVLTIDSVLTRATGLAPEGVPFDNQLNLSIDREKLLLYGIDYNRIYSVLRTAFKGNEAGTLRSYQQYLPILIADKGQSVEQVLRHTMVAGYPLSAFVKVRGDEDLKTITAGKDGEYVPFSFYGVDKGARLASEVRKAVSELPQVAPAVGAWNVDFSGSFFSNKKMLAELVVILGVSLLLMYFILAAQFESFVQPFIVMMEIPVDVAASLIFLWLCGHTLNLMSAIGIVVTCSVIINDSILKLDAIDQFRKEGMPLMEAIHTAGKRRLRPIVMTALTSIFGLVPTLFSYDLGNELQKPLVIAMISAMVVGTVISLFFIPLVYWGIYRKEEKA